LIEALIRASCVEGEKVVDPFAGSGVVGEVARAMKRESLCIDIEDAPAGNQGAEPIQRLTAAGQNTGNALELDL
jgi:16S rRNA G966 N2-methylase RsmD